MSFYEPESVPDGYQIVLPPNYDSTKVAQAINEAPPKPHWTGSAGFVIAMVAVVLIIAFIIIRLVFTSNGNCCNKTCSNAGPWSVRTITTATATATGSNGVLWRNTFAGSGNVSVVITPPSNASGQAFIIDNTTGSGVVNVSTSPQTGTFNVPVGRSTQFIWINDNTLNAFPYA